MKDIRTLEPFRRAFKRIAGEYDSLAIDDFCLLFADSPVGHSSH